MTAISTLDALGLSQDAGSLASGHRPLAAKHENDLNRFDIAYRAGSSPVANGGDLLREGDVIVRGE